MKILIITQYYIPYQSGLTVYAKRLAEDFASKGDHVTVLTVEHENGLRRRETMNGVTVIRAPYLMRFQRGAYSPMLAIEFLRQLWGHDVVNIHAPLFEAGLFAALAFLFKAGKRPVLTYHCDLSMKSGIFSRVIENIYYLSVRAAGLICGKIVMNSLDYGRSSRLAGFSKKIIEIRPPITGNDFYKVDTGAFKRRFGIAEDHKIVGFTGRLVREKGLYHLVRAMTAVKKEFRVKCVIAGEGEKVAGGRKESVKTGLLDVISGLGLTDDVVFTGYLQDNELLEFYSAIDVLVLPSVDPLESFGMVQVEAMLCGCPVIATDMPGVRDILTRLPQGLLVPPGDIEALTDAIKRILRDREVYIKDRGFVIAAFNAEKTFSAYKELFDRYI